MRQSWRQTKLKHSHMAATFSMSAQRPEIACTPQHVSYSNTCLSGFARPIHQHQHVRSYGSRSLVKRQTELTKGHQHAGHYCIACQAALFKRKRQTQLRSSLTHPHAHGLHQHVGHTCENTGCTSEPRGLEKKEACPKQRASTAALPPLHLQFFSGVSLRASGKEGPHGCYFNSSFPISFDLILLPRWSAKTAFQDHSGCYSPFLLAEAPSPLRVFEREARDIKGIPWPTCLPEAWLKAPFGPHTAMLASPAAAVRDRMRRLNAPTSNLGPPVQAGMSPWGTDVPFIHRGASGSWSLLRLAQTRLHNPPAPPRTRRSTPHQMPALDQRRPSKMSPSELRWPRAAPPPCNAVGCLELDHGAGGQALAKVGFSTKGGSPATIIREWMRIFDMEVLQEGLDEINSVLALRPHLPALLPGAPPPAPGDPEVLPSSHCSSLQRMPKAQRYDP